MTDCVLGVDVGTSGVRIAARGRDGAMLAMATSPMAAPLQVAGRVTQDAQMWWDAVISAVSKLDLGGLNVLAIAIDGTSGTILPIDAGGNPVGPGSMYNDVASSEVLKRVAAVASPDTAALGGTSPLARALMLLPGYARIVHQADWLLGKMSGVFDVSDENNALKSGYDPVTRQWPLWIAETGFNVARFPRVVAAGVRIGTIDRSVADQFKLRRDVAIVTGTTDGCAAFLASGAAVSGDGVTSLGTTLTLKLLSATPVFSPRFGIYSHRIGEQWLAGGASNTGGAVLAQSFSTEKIAQYTEDMNPDVPTGLDYYPLPAPGERFPVNDPQMQPRLAPRPGDDRTYFQAILEGIARVEALGYATLAELGATRLRSIRSVGGGAANDKWTQMRLRALGVPALASVSEHAAMGTARLAWRGSGMTHKGRIAGLSEIASQFDAMLIDQFGVIHDGHRLYPGAARALAELHALGVPVIIMTNSGKLAATSITRTVALGIPRAHFVDCVSSGEVAYNSMTFERTYLIGRAGADYGFKGVTFVNDVRDADVMLILGSNFPETTLAQYEQMFRELTIPAICCNPDKLMITEKGLQPGPGAIADLYQRMGGSVRWIGKPYPEIYSYAIGKLGPEFHKDVELKRVLCIGDSPEHDVAGGTAAGFSTLLVQQGVSADMPEASIHPYSDYIMRDFAW